MILTRFRLFNIRLLNHLNSLLCQITGLLLLNTITLLLILHTRLLGRGRLQVIELFLDLVGGQAVIDGDQVDQFLLIDLQLSVIHGL